MLGKRVLVAVVLLPVLIGGIVLGGAAYAGLISITLAIAGWELARLFRAGDYQPALFLTAVGALLVVWGRYFARAGGDPFAYDSLIVGGFVVAAMTWHLIAYEKGRDRAASDFVVTLGGMVYMGVLGGYLFSLRNLPDGMWWLLTTLFAVWLADSGAYFYGKRFGKRKLSPRLSPKKTWEGYIAGVVASTLITPLFALWWVNMAGVPLSVTPLRGGILAFVLAVVTPLGDLGESMFKRQFGIKDSGNILPGHGGMFDRIDSWVWAGFISYFLIETFFL